MPDTDPASGPDTGADQTTYAALHETLDGQNGPLAPGGDCLLVPGVNGWTLYIFVPPILDAGDLGS